MKKILTSVHNKWNRFWFGNDNPHTIGLLRMAIGFVAFWRFTSIPLFHIFGDIVIAFPNHFFHSPNDYFIKHFSDPVPYLNFLPTPSFTVFSYLEVIMLVLSIFFMLGLFTRFSGKLLFVLLLYKLSISQFFLHHDIYMILISLFLLSFSPYVQTYSIDRLFKKKKSTVPQKMYRLRVTHMIGLMLSSLYFFSLFSKLINPFWLDGTIVKLFASLTIMRGTLFTFMLNHINIHIITLGLFFAYGFLIFAYWNKKTKPYALCVGFGLHLFIGLSMGIWIFGVMMMLLHLVHFENFLKKPLARFAAQ